MYLDDHHGEGAWPSGPRHRPDAGDAGRRAPDGYFVPPYVGHNGWVGVHLNRGLDWEEIAGVVEDAWLVRAPKRLADSLR